MALNILRENIEVERIAGEGAVQTMIEGNVMLPSSARDIAALYTDARLEMGNVEVQADRVATDGQVFFTLLYTAEDEVGVQSIETAMNFSHILEVAGATPKMQIRVQGDIEHTEADISNGRVTLRAIARIRARASARENISCIGEIQDVQALQTLEVSPKSLCTIAQGKGTLALDERFELPYGLESEEALFANARASVERAVALDNRAELYGQVSLDVYHRTAMFDRPLARTRHILPFTASIDLAGASVSTPIQTAVEVREVSVRLQEEEEESYLYCELTVLAEAKAMELVEIQAVEDAYTASDELLSLTSRKITARTGAREESGVDSVKSVLSLESGQSPIGVVLAAFARPTMWELSTDSRTRAEGVLEATIIYLPLGGDRPIAINEDIPFRSTYDFALPEGCWTRLTAEDTEAIQITGDRVEIKCNVRLSAQVYETEDYHVALDAELLEEGGEIPGGVTLYFVQPGDTLWSVARRFRTTRESLTRFNPEITELQGGEKLLLYKRRTVV